VADDEGLDALEPPPDEGLDAPAAGEAPEEMPAAPPWLRAYLALLGTLALLGIYVIEAGGVAVVAAALEGEATLPEAPPGALSYVGAEVTLILVIVGAERLLSRLAARAPKLPLK